MPVAAAAEAAQPLPLLRVEAPQLFASCRKVWVQQPDCFRTALAHCLGQLQLHQLTQWWAPGLAAESSSTARRRQYQYPYIVSVRDAISRGGSSGDGDGHSQSQQEKAKEAEAAHELAALNKLDERLWRALVQIRLGVAIFHASASASSARLIASA